MNTRPSNSPSITDLLIATLCSGRSTRRFYQILRERQFKCYEKNSVRVALSRLNKKGYVNNSPTGWSITQKGRLQNKKTYLLSYISSPFKETTTKNTIVSFDIPVPDRVKRNWLRNQVKIFGYKMLQQSLWLGPGPLPANFLKRLEELEIRKNVKIFTVTKKNI